MDGMEDVRIDDTLTIPAGEIGFEASRSGGPGGQHVNKASTKVTLTFEIDASAVL
jgi:ribosome-associated protein